MKDYINHSERLIGCNIQVIQGDGWTKGREGEIFRITDRGDEWRGRFGFATNRDCLGITIENGNGKIVLNDIFLKKFKEEKIAVNCETEDEAEEFVGWLRSNTEDNYTRNLWADHKEKSCYYFSNNFWYSREYDLNIGYTILKFSDTIFPKTSVKDFLDTPQGQEFIKYWKENELAIEFENSQDNKDFCFRFDTTDASTLESVECVEWAGEEWLHCHKEFYEDLGYGIIQYKDIPNYKEILDIKKISSRQLHRFSNTVLGLHTEIGTGRIQLQRNTNTNEKEKTMSYKITKPFNLQDILAAKPCNSDGEVYELMEQMKDQEWPYDKEWNTWEECKLFPVIIKYKDWFIEKGFIEEDKEEFQPFNLTLKINTKDELLDLYHRLNQNHYYLYNNYNNDTEYPSPEKLSCLNIWRQVEKEMYRVKE